MDESATLDHNSDVGSNDITVNEDYTLTINAGDTLETDGGISVKEDGTLIVKGTIIGTNSGKELKIDKGTLIVESGGRIEWDGKLTTDSDPSTVTIDGWMEVGDIFTNKITVSGSGGMFISGTMNNDGGSLFGCTSSGDGCCGLPDCTLGTAPLPIELVSFEAELIDDRVELKWITASEINNDFFTIEKSRDGVSWEIIGTINGAGNSNNVLTYSSDDLDPYPGVSYYRLKQTDFNGDFEYFEIKSIENVTESSILIIPNPNEGADFQINFGSFQGMTNFRIMDISGRVIHEQHVNLYSPNISLNVALLEKLNAGTYLISGICGSASFNEQFIVR